MVARDPSKVGGAAVIEEVSDPKIGTLHRGRIPRAGTNSKLIIKALKHQDDCFVRKKVASTPGEVHFPIRPKAKRLENKAINRAFRQSWGAIALSSNGWVAIVDRPRGAHLHAKIFERFLSRAKQQSRLLLAGRDQPICCQNFRIWFSLDETVGY